MRKRGLELVSITNNGISGLQRSANDSAAESGAPKLDFDPDLTRLIELWPSLSDLTKRSIMEFL